MSSRTVIVVCATLVSGCATVQVQVIDTTTEKVGQLPLVGVASSAPVGGTLFTQFHYWSRIGQARLAAAVNMNFMLGRVTAKEGEQLTAVLIDGKSALCTNTKAYHDPLVGPWRAACFIDPNGSGIFTKVMVAPGAIWFEKDLPNPVAYNEKSEEIVIRPGSFKYELLYQGLSNQTLRLAYREYVNDLARPAYFQDVTYGVQSFPTTITFRTVRLEVLSADNDGIRYRVLSTF